jgi:hypothetical protein
MLAFHGGYPMVHRIVPALLVLVVLSAAVPATAQESVVEPSTEKSFPARVTVSSGEKEHTLSITGVTVRKKFVFKVYAMAHYMEDPPSGSRSDLMKAMTVDGKVKQITMDFAREVTADQIRGAYGDGFKENAAAAELASLKPSIDTFLGYFDAPVRENDTIILRWFPGGKIVAVISNREKPSIVNQRFAEVLWTIWFGEDSIVDREELVARIAK